MKYTLLTLLVALSNLSSSFLATTSQDASISTATALIKKYTESNTQLFNVSIVNAHNGRYTVTSTLWASADSVRLMTYIIDMTGGKRDTVLNLSKKDFLLKLNRASYPYNSTKMAGHHQTIRIKKGDQEEVFETVDGRALMNLLEYGE